MTTIQLMVLKLHDAGFVHGDLRAPNFIVDGDRLLLVDFDWGGKDGEVEYPTRYLNPELLTGRDRDDLKIRKEDDLRMLRYTLDKGKHK